MFVVYYCFQNYILGDRSNLKDMLSLLAALIMYKGLHVKEKETYEVKDS